jgi:hypothetical protein
MTPATPAAVAGVAPASSVFVSGENRARRRRWIASGRDWGVGILTWWRRSCSRRGVAYGAATTEFEFGGGLAAFGRTGGGAAEVGRTRRQWGSIQRGRVECGDESAAENDEEIAKCGGAGRRS